MSGFVSISPQMLAVHGLGVSLTNVVPGIEGALKHVLGDFVTPALPSGFHATVGQIRRFELTELQKSISPKAQRVVQPQEMLEIYKDGEQYWLVDDRWGMAEVNLLRGRWTSWILANPIIDAHRAMEYAVMWPLAQLLRPKGLFLLPSISITRNGFSALILSPFSMETELRTLIRAGYNIIGQRWTALREEEGRLAMMHVPGMIERQAQRPKFEPGTRKSFDPLSQWVDLNREYLNSRQQHAFCDAVLIAEPGRRVHAHVRELNHFTAISVLRKSWPMIELNPQRRSGQLPARLAQHTRVAELQLSRNPNDLLVMLDTLKKSPKPKMATAGFPAMSLYVPKAVRLSA